MAKKNIVIQRDNGILEVSRPTSSAVVLKVPYRELAKGLKIANNFLVYILYARRYKDLDISYIGKSKNGIKDRPLSHEDKFDAWDYCIILTQHRENTFFNDGVIQYIENRLCCMLNENSLVENMTKMTNDNTINDYERDDCELYINDILDMLKAIGIDLQGNVTKSKQIAESTDIEQSIVNTTVIEEDPNRVYYIQRENRKRGNINAIMVVIGDLNDEKSQKYKVLAGSQVAAKLADSTYEQVKKTRKKCKIVNNILQEDVVCSSISDASAIVLGLQSNGWTWWRNMYGQTADEVLRW